MEGMTRSAPSILTSASSSSLSTLTTPTHMSRCATARHGTARHGTAGLGYRLKERVGYRAELVRALRKIHRRVAAVITYLRDGDPRT